jgi:exonuclease VII small subunit
VPEGNLLRLVDVKTGQAVLTRLERAELALEESARQRQRAERLAAEVQRLQHLLNEQRNANGR